MDIATITGTLVGFTLVLGAILIGGGAGAFLNVPSLMITVGGTAAATLINFPLGKVVGIFGVIKKTLLHAIPSPQEQIRIMVDYATVCRRDGLLSLEEKLEEIKDDFLSKGVQLLVDGTEGETLRDIMSTETEYLRQRHVLGKKIMESMGAAAPAFGMIGTLIGLVQMLRTLDDPSGIGSGMATALLTTFYGALMANLIFLPLAGKLEARSNEEVLVRDIQTEALVSMQAGDNPRLIEQKLKSFVAPKLRAAEQEKSR
jgi:chemotaxis protein MotA